MQGIQIFAIIAYDYSIDNKVEKIRSKRGDDPVVKLVNTKEAIRYGFRDTGFILY